MSFDSLLYLGFLPAVYLLYRLMPFRGQNAMLLLASYVFYGAWDSRFLLLILLSTAMDYCAGLVIDRGNVSRTQAIRVLGWTGLAAALSAAIDWAAVLGGAPAGTWLAKSNLGLLAGMAALAALAWPIHAVLMRLTLPTKRRVALILSIAGNLGLLGFFKYFNFFVDSANVALAGLGADPTSWRLDIVLPVGISFYTFQTMSYTIDVYRGRLRATEGVLDFALFVAYFPQLVAGPIERATHLLPQLTRSRQWRWDQFAHGLWLILLGLFKKIAIADGVAGSVNSVYGSTGNVTWLDIVAATLLFAIQIYCDFSGYSDIARGSSRLFGIELMRNFRTPYFATNPSEFWRRWHISLSTWLRDYLYVPLGGSRSGVGKTYRNLLLTMVLGGLWHGAAWNFVAWGLYQGILLCAHRAIGSAGKDHSRSALGSIGKMLGFFLLTCYGWLLFRATSFEQIAQFTHLLVADFGNLRSTISTPTFAALIGAPALLLIDVADYRAGIGQAYLRSTPVARGCIAAFMLYVLMMGTSNVPQQFIYFQF